MVSNDCKWIQSVSEYNLLLVTAAVAVIVVIVIENENRHNGLTCYFSRQYTAQYPQHWPPLAGRVLLKPIFNSALNCCPSLPPSSLHTGLTFYTLAEKCLEWVLEFINIVRDIETICLNVWSKDPCQSGYKSTIPHPESVQSQFHPNIY